MTIKLNNAAIEQLKKSQWQEVEKDKKITGDFSTNLLWEITGLNADILNTKIENAYYEATYTRTENGENEYAYNLCIGYLTENDASIFSCKTDDSDTDFLELFTETEEQTEDENPIELLKKALKLCADKEVGTSDITSVIEDFDYLYDAIKENIIDNLGIEDLSDSLIEDAAYEYIERNPSDCYYRAMDNMESCEVKDKIIDYLSDNL